MKVETQKNEEVFEFLELDEFHLDQEWKNQPKIYYKYSEKLANARKDMAEAKSNLEVTMADLDRKIRISPDDYGITKVTENSVSNMALVQKEYRTANQKYIEARYKVDLLEAAVSSLEHRKKALENLVQLWAMSYFSEPRTPKGVPRETADEIVKPQRRTTK